MKKHVRRTAFALAVLMVLLAMPTSVFAADFKLYSVQAINLETGERGTLVLLEHQGKAYIDPADATVLASVDGWEMNDDNGNQRADGRAEGFEGHQCTDDVLGHTEIFIMDTQHDLCGRHDNAVEEYAEHELAYIAAGNLEGINEIRKDSQDETLPFLTCT